MSILLLSTFFCRGFGEQMGGIKDSSPPHTASQFDYFSRSVFFQFDFFFCYQDQSHYNSACHPLVSLLLSSLCIDFKLFEQPAGLTLNQKSLPSSEAWHRASSQL